VRSVASTDVDLIALVIALPNEVHVSATTLRASDSELATFMGSVHKGIEYSRLNRWDLIFGIDLHDDSASQSVFRLRP